MPDNDPQVLTKWGLPDWVTSAAGAVADKFVPGVGRYFEPDDNQPRVDIATGGGAVADQPGLGSLVSNAIFGTDTDRTYDWNPLADADDMPTALNGNGCNLQVMVAPQQKVINKAPRGYVIVETENAAGVPVKVAMLKPVAKSCGLWKPRAKPVMTAADAKTIRRAASLQNKVDRLAKMSNSLCSKAPLRRTRSKR